MQWTKQQQEQEDSRPVNIVYPYNQGGDAQKTVVHVGTSWSSSSWSSKPVWSWSSEPWWSQSSWEVPSWRSTVEVSADNAGDAGDVGHRGSSSDVKKIEKLEYYNYIQSKDPCATQISNQTMNVVLTILHDVQLPLSRLGDLVWVPEVQSFRQALIPTVAECQQMESLVPRTYTSMFGVHATGTYEISGILKNGFIPVSEKDGGAGDHGVFCKGRDCWWPQDQMVHDDMHKWVTAQISNPKNTSNVLIELFWRGIMTTLKKGGTAGQVAFVSQHNFVHYKTNQENYYVVKETDVIIKGLWLVNPVMQPGVAAERLRL